MKRLLDHQRQLILEMRRSRLRRVAVPKRAARLLSRTEFDRTYDGLAIGRVIAIPFLTREGNGPEESRAARAAVAREVDVSAGEAEDIAPLHVERTIQFLTLFSGRGKRGER